MTRDEVEQQFLEEFNALLKKWGAEIAAEDHYPGYPECGEDIRMTVFIPGMFDRHGETIRDRCEIDIGCNHKPK